MADTAPTTRRRWFQFRLSFLLIVCALVAVVFSGFRINDIAEHPAFVLIVRWLPVAIFIYPSIGTALVLFIGRSRVAVAVGCGLVVAAVVDCAMQMVFGFSGMSYFGLSLHIAAIFGLFVLLWDEITPVRLTLATLTCFFFGVTLQINWALLRII
ncbi:MAG TPA: hypothetical protein VGN12_02315 [Pirellulales bacterium]